MSEETFYLPATALAKIGGSGGATQRASEPQPCEAECCQPKVYEGYWRDCDEEWAWLNRDRSQEMSVAARRAAWMEMHGGRDYPPSNYGGAIDKYFDGWHEFEINWAKAGRVEHAD